MFVFIADPILRLALDIQAFSRSDVSEVPGSYLSRDIDCRDCAFCYFTLFLHKNAGMVP
jgi:hypothetical protein